MKNIFYIVKTDFRNIVKNPAALIVIAAVAFLPSLYAWLNIAASWDPYSNTKGVPIAVVSLDKGAKIQDKEFNIGDEVIVSLTKNKNLGWKFVSKDEAVKGVKHGDYYAAIIIPKDFSKKLISVTTDDIEKPKIEYYINEKVNAISPKVTKSGASAVVENIQSNFIKEANKTIMTVFNSLGIELESNQDNIEKVRNAIFRLEEDMPDIYSKLQLAGRDLDLADAAVDKSGESLERMDDIHDKAQRLNKQLITKLEDNEETVNETIDAITTNLRSTQKAFRKVPQFTNDLSEKGEDLDQLISSLREKQNKLDEASNRLEDIYKYLKEQDQSLKNSSKIKDLQKSLEQNEEDLKQLKLNLQQMIKDLKSGNNPAVDIIKQTQSLSDKLADNLDTLSENYDTTLYPRVQTLIKELNELSTGMADIMERASKINNSALNAVQKLKENREKIDPELVKQELENTSSLIESNLERVNKIVNLLGIASDITNSERIAGLEENFKSLQSQLQKAQQIVDKALEMAEKGESPSLTILTQLEESLKTTQARIDEAIKKYDVNSKNALDQAVSELQKIDKNMREKFNQLQNSQTTVDNKLANLLETAENPEKTIAVLERMVGRVDRGLTSIDSIQNGLQNVQDFIDSNTVTEEIERIKTIQDNLKNTKTSIDQVIARIKEAKSTGKDKLEDVNRLSRKIDSSIEDMIQFISGDLSRKYKAITRDATSALYDVSDVLDEVNKKIPKVRTILEKASKGVDEGKEKLELANKYFPKAKDTVSDIAQKIRKLEEEGDLDQLIDILKKDPSGVSNFLAKPVLLDEHKLYPIPNYGSAMNPFYSVLSLWVGALLLVSSLKVDIDEKAEFKSYETYLGRLLTFVGIGITQALIVTTGNLFIMHTYVVDKFLYVLFGIMISAVFVTIVYTLVSVFGNTGKVLAIVLMVMQLGGSGGTFPVQMAPPFFQHIHSFLPFTHAIALLREAVGGIIWGFAWKQIIYLVVYFIIALIMGIGLKKFFNKSSDKFMEKAKKSKIVI
ncbi:YhgE/Pip domain-containing protein [Pseudobacillus sp. FSL P4-0506]|uniref:YhgE/Pip domain-containing protein n=1 Tax=unclassified Pseudobacillus TaxID=2619284 RepID=UPI0030F9A6CC